MTGDMCLKYGNHNRTVMDRFVQLLESGQLVDCTIGSEGQHLKAHKVILAASSPYFELLFKDVVESHITVILHGITLKNLKSILHFIYHGYVNIPRRQLVEFVKCAQTLQIEGLIASADSDEEISQRVIEARAEEGINEDVKILDYDSCPVTTVRIERNAQSGQAHASTSSAGQSTTAPPPPPATAAASTAAATRHLQNDATEAASSTRASPSPKTLVPCTDSDLPNPLLTIASVHAAPSLTPDPTSDSSCSEPRLLCSPAPRSTPEAQVPLAAASSRVSQPSSSARIIKFPTVHLKRLDDAQVSRHVTRRVVRHSFAGACTLTSHRTSRHSSPNGTPSAAFPSPSNVDVAAVGTLDQPSATQISCSAPASDIETRNNDVFVSEERDNPAASATFGCTICSESFPSWTAVARHLESHARERPYKCTLCDKDFVKQWVLRRHLYSMHGEGMLFKCKMCGRGFHQRAMLRKHLETHVDDTPPAAAPPPAHECFTCGKQFANPRRLRAHVLLHDGSRLACETCGREFSRHWNLQQHLLVRPTGKQHRCRFCCKLFSLSGHLQRHLATHEGAKPFKCPHCRKTFARKQALRIHIRLHVRDRPFRCETCGKLFRNAVYLLMHSRLHLEERPYKCSLCPRAFALSSSLAKHLSRIHNARPE